MMPKALDKRLHVLTCPECDKLLGYMHGCDPSALRLWCRRCKCEVTPRATIARTATTEP